MKSPQLIRQASHLGHRPFSYSRLGVWYLTAVIRALDRVVRALIRSSKRQDATKRPTNSEVVSSCLKASYALPPSFNFGTCLSYGDIELDPPAPHHTYSAGYRSLCKLNLRGMGPWRPVSGSFRSALTRTCQRFQRYAVDTHNILDTIQPPLCASTPAS